VLNLSNESPVSSTYPNAGSYIVKHFAKSTGSCKSDTAKKVIQIFARPQVDFDMLMGCLADSAVRFTDNTLIFDGPGTFLFMEFW
jgi:hypothetical protein